MRLKLWVPQVLCVYGLASIRYILSTGALSTACMFGLQLSDFCD